MKRKFWILVNRLILFKLKGIKFGCNMRVANYLHIKRGHNTNISIGNNFAFYSGDFYNPLARNICGAIELEDNANLEIGDNVGISSACIWVYKYVKIGSGTKIGGDCILIDSDAHSLNYKDREKGYSDRPNAKSKGITIENDVLIGTRCIILKGVTIGARSVIGAGSVVSKDIPSDCIAAGNPAKVIKKINS